MMRIPMFFVQMVNQAPNTLSDLEAVLQDLFLFLLRNHLFVLTRWQVCSCPVSDPARFIKVAEVDPKLITCKEGPVK
jgi:hypothetical protein